MNTILKFDETYKKLINKAYPKNNIEEIPIIFTNKEPIFVQNKIKSLNKVNLTPEEIKKIYEDEKYSICNLLGTYNPEKQEINIHLKGISRVSNKPNIDFTLLTQVVIIHELSHFFSHKHILNGKTWDNDKYEVENVKIHEFLAQLSTYLIIKDNKELLDVFLELNTYQSDEYKLWDKFKDENLTINNYNDILIGLRELDKPEIHNIGRFIFKLFWNSSKESYSSVIEKDFCFYDKDENYYKKDDYHKKFWDFFRIQKDVYTFGL